jgi:hypothetical protein
MITLLPEIIVCHTNLETGGIERKVCPHLVHWLIKILAAYQMHVVQSASQMVYTVLDSGAEYPN